MTPTFRTEFLDKLNSLMRRLSYCVVRKHEHLARYGVAALETRTC